MTDIKIAFFDLDGTLLENDEDRLSDKTIETLQRLKVNGIRICLATGRASAKIPKFEGVEFDAYLAFNGSFCYTKDTCIFSNYIPDEDVKILLRNAKTMDRSFSVALKSRVLTDGNNKRTIEYYSKINLALEIVEDFEAAIAEEPVYQMMIDCREEEYDILLKDVRGAKVTAWSDYAVDIIPANGSKAVAVEKTLAYYGIHPSQAIAFGDSGNDIEMLQTVGCGVAMGNALEKVKAIADDVCRPVSEDGVYYYCVKHGLI